MRKFIEVSRQYLIECDYCDYKIINQDGGSGKDIKEYINKPCPKCGENLLTEKDYYDDLKLLKAIDKLNRWLSWITFFIPKKHESHLTVKTHNGIHISDN